MKVAVKLYAPNVVDVSVHENVYVAAAPLALLSVHAPPVQPKLQNSVCVV